MYAKRAMPCRILLIIIHLTPKWRSARVLLFPYKSPKCQSWQISELEDWQPVKVFKKGIIVDKRNYC